jgi:hypothetical protein
MVTARTSHRKQLEENDYLAQLTKAWAKCLSLIIEGQRTPRQRKMFLAMLQNFRDSPKASDTIFQTFGSASEPWMVMWDGQNIPTELYCALFHNKANGWASFEGRSLFTLTQEYGASAARAIAAVMASRGHVLPQSFPGEMKGLPRVDELEFSIRTANCLKAAGILELEQLVEKTPKELLALEHFGRGNLREVQDTLAGMGLSLRTE